MAIVLKPAAEPPPTAASAVSHRTVTDSKLFVIAKTGKVVVDEFKEDLLEDMKWDIEEGKTSFTPVTIDDIPECEVTTATPQGCVSEV